jgi:protein-glutamine gamma-glutamyltransferase
MKKFPSLLLGLAILFWGWQTNFWIIAVPLALILESQPLLRWRWQLSTAELRRAGNYGLIAAGLALLYLILSQRSFGLLYTLLQWFPVIFSPLMVALTYSTREIVDLRELLPGRRRPAQTSGADQTSSGQSIISVPMLYFLLCLFSASATNTRGYGFYAGLVGLAAGMLWAKRSPKTSPIVWFCLMLLVANLGFVSHVGLNQLQGKVEQQTNHWFQQLSDQDQDPFQAHTRLGTLGQLKLSEAIRLRVTIPNRQLVPMLLRDASYNRYNFSTWIAHQAKFTAVPRQPNGTTWPLRPQLEEKSRPLAALTITTHLNRGKGILSLPSGSLQLNQLPVEQIERNQYGVVKVTGNTETVSYQVPFDPRQSWDSPPSETDLDVPDPEKPAIKQVVQKLQLTGKPSQAVLTRLQNYFQQEFKYSLQLADTNDATTPLSAFLLKHHAGHCEYFASATVLLLRQAGIPARYATGYLVHEFNDLEGQYVVRGRDAHAWTMAYIDGSWQSFDTTPGSWVAPASQGVSVWQRVLDLWSFLGVKLSAQVGNGLATHAGWWLLGLGIVLLLWQLRRLRLKRFAVPRTSVKPLELSMQAGADSEFYGIEQFLAKSGYQRQPDELLSIWLQRLQTDLPESHFTSLLVILRLHHQYRFDPAGITAQDRTQLKVLCYAWLQSYIPTPDSLAPPAKVRDKMQD